MVTKEYFVFTGVLQNSNGNTHFALSEIKKIFSYAMLKLQETTF